MSDKPSYEELEQKVNILEKELAKVQYSNKGKYAISDPRYVVSGEEHYRFFFNNASDVIFIHDLSGKTIEFNQLACDRLGYSREELFKMRPEDKVMLFSFFYHKLDIGLAFIFIQ